MFSNIMINLINMISLLIQCYIWAIVIWTFLSWIPILYQSKIGEILTKIVGPFLNLFNFAKIGMFNFAPIIAILFLELIQIIISKLGNIILGI